MGSAQGNRRCGVGKVQPAVPSSDPVRTALPFELRQTGYERQRRWSRHVADLAHEWATDNNDRFAWHRDLLAEDRLSNRHQLDATHQAVAS